VLIKKVTSFITRNKLISKGEHVMAALSGGRDSVCLLYILNQLKSQLDFTLSAIHINHGIRGQASDNDQAFAERLCRSLDIKCESFQLSGFDKTASEDALRKARYDIFDDLLSQNTVTKIATGHHLNDQLETYLMRLFKGSGVKGLLGIPHARDNYIRPLLETTREEINSFCSENDIDYVDDHSNAIPDKLRNKVRLKLVSQIEKIFGKHYLEYFLKSHCQYKNLYEEYYQQNQLLFRNICHTKNNQIELALSAFKALSELQKVQLVEYCFSNVYGLHCSISNEHFSGFNSFVKNARTGAKFLFSDSIEVLKDRDRLIFYTPGKKSIKKKKLYLNKSIKFGDYKLLLDKVVKSYSIDNNSLVEIICADNIQLPLTIRSWQDGDFFYPLGQNHRQKVSDFFTNNKVSRINKSKIPIICNGEQIVWLGGLRIDNRYKVTKRCKNLYKLEMKNGKI